MKIPSSLIVISDVHFGVEDPEAWEFTLQLLGLFEPDLFLYLGDLLEFESLSRYLKKPSVMLTLGGEILKFRQETLRLKELMGKPILFLPGNHEDRLERYLASKAPELSSLQEQEILQDQPLSLSSLLGFKKIGVREVEDKRNLKFGKLNFIHGHELALSSKFPARSLLEKASTNIFFGHVHKADRAFHISWDRETIGSWSNPCLRSLDPDWDSNPQWQQGFSHIQFSRSGFFHVDQIIFMRERGKLHAMVDGTLHTYQPSP